ncbi:MAG: hypothetical protein ABIE07_11970 [Candidatus Zixiibacteriota bacterium]
MKFYEFSDSDWRTQIDEYDIEMIMRAFQIGNVLGVDSFDVKLKVTARETISPSLEQNETPLLRIDSLRLVLPDNENAIYPKLIPWNFGDAHLKSSIFENRLCDQVEAEPVYLPDKYEAIELKFDLVKLDRNTGDELSREKIQKTIIKKMAMHQYNIE